MHITDFGIAKKYTPLNGKDTSGTMGYIAPEVLRSENHTYCVDFYAIGIITYEFLFGHRPYLARTKRELRELILTHQAQVEIDELPNDWSNESADFINKLIQRKPKNRLGYTNIDEVKHHKWFNNFDWGSLQSGLMKSPYVPKKLDNFDKKYCSAIEKIGNETIQRYNQYLMDEQYDYKFIRFTSSTIPEEFKCSNNHLTAHQLKHTSNNNCSVGDSTTKDTNNLGNSNNSSALQQKLSRNKLEKRYKKNDKKFDCSRSLSYSGGTCSISMPSVHNNNNNNHVGIKSNNNNNNNNNNIEKDNAKSPIKKEKQEINNDINNEHNNIEKNKASIIQNINNKNFPFNNNNNNNNNSKNSNIISLYGIGMNPLNNNNNGINNIPINSNNLAFERDNLRPSFIHSKHKKSSVLRNNLSNHKKNASFLLGASSHTLSSRRKSPPSSSTLFREKRIASSNSSKHLHINNNLNQSHLVLDKKLPIINLSFTKRKNMFNNGSNNEQDLSFGHYNYAPQILNYSDRRGSGRKIRNQYYNLNFYYANNNNNNNINFSFNQKQEQGNGYNTNNNSSMNKSLYNGQSNHYVGKLKLTTAHKYNQNKSISAFNDV